MKDMVIIKILESVLPHPKGRGFKPATFLCIKKSKIGQFDKGVFANRDFKKGEIVLRYNLKPLTKKEFDNLPKEEQKFTHKHWGVIYLYSSPERYVNHSQNPNTIQDLKNRCDMAKRDIKKGEEITTDAMKDEIS